MTIGEARAALTARLRAAGVPTPEVDAALLLGHVLGCTPTRLVVDAAAQLPTTVAGRLEALAARRVAREPLQLLLGSVGFRYLDVEVRPGVFIPRPETEVLAGEAIARTPPGGIVVEPCTGTGAVACSVACEATPSLVVATDVSPAAVDLARSNAARAGAEVRVLLGDLLAPVPGHVRGAVDVLVCNPPYLAAAEVQALEPEVLHDPPEALIAGPTGDEVIDRLLAEAPAWLRPGGWLLLELDPTRAAATAERAERAGFADVAIVPDLTGADRILTARALGNIRGMPRVSIYLPDDLYREVKARGLPLSSLVQQAIQHALEASQSEEWVTRVRSRPVRHHGSVDTSALLVEVRVNFGR